MAEKIKKVIIRTLVVLLIFAIVALAAAYMFLRLYIIPKYNSLLGEDAAIGETLSEKSFLSFAKYLTDRQMLDNIANFDKNSASGLLEAAKEIEEEVPEEPTPAPKRSVWNKRVTARTSAIPTPTPVPTPTPTPVPDKSQVVGSTAEERIRNAASAEEIKAGLAILSKISISKVNQLRKSGQTAELKKYIKSVLTSAEIQKALSLYNKYNHLL